MTYEELEKALEFVSEEKQKLLKKNELLETEIKDLKADIIRLYNTMMALDSINEVELELFKVDEEIEEL